MKYLNKIFTTVGVVVLLLVFGCTKNFEEVNTNPNEPVEVPTAYLMTHAQGEIAVRLWNGWWNGRFGLLYSQYWSQTAYSEESRFQPRQSTTNDYWNSFYTSLMNLEEIIKLNTDSETSGIASQSGSNSNQIAVCRIMKAYTFHMMTDVWGDIPYEEALLGNENTTPAYTSQQAVYDGLLLELDQAQAQIELDAQGAQGDLIYGGNMALWKKFANSLRMRIALRYNPTQTAVITDAIADGVFESSDEDATLVFDGSAPSYNPLYSAFFVDNRTDFSCSKPLIDMLINLGDPRLSFYADPAETSGTYVGLTYGLDSEHTAQESGPSGVHVSLASSTHVLAATSPAIFMGYAEVCFIKSELGLGDGTQAEYEKGIAASLNFWGVEQADISAYVSSVSSATPATIGDQKWLSLYMQGLQGWFEWRRTGYPALSGPADDAGVNTGNKEIPSRLYYPTNEQVLNLDNYNAAVSAQGVDNQATILWCDK